MDQKKKTSPKDDASDTEAGDESGQKPNGHCGSGSDEEAADWQLEYHTAAKILDRLFLWLFLFIIIGINIVMYMVYPFIYKTLFGFN